MSEIKSLKSHVRLLSELPKTEGVAFAKQLIQICYSFSLALVGCTAKSEVDFQCVLMPIKVYLVYERLNKAITNLYEVIDLNHFENMGLICPPPSKINLFC